MNICTKWVCVFCHSPQALRTFFLPGKQSADQVVKIITLPGQLINISIVWKVGVANLLRFAVASLGHFDQYQHGGS